MIRPSVVRRHGQADKDGLVLAAYNIDEPDAAILNKDGHITSDLGHGGANEQRRLRPSERRCADEDTIRR